LLLLFFKFIDIDIRDFGEWNDIAGKCLSVFSVIVFSGSVKW